MENKLLVLITTYSRGYNLPAVVESVVNQTFKNYKILIADDRSPNDPTEIINGIKSKYPNVDIEHRRNYENIGEGINMNAALGKEWNNGFKYTVLLQDDTVYTDNNFLSEGIQALENKPNIKYCSGLVSRNGRPDRFSIVPPTMNAFEINGIDFWRLWATYLGLHWAAGIFRYNDTIKYRLDNDIRKDCLNGDNLFLLYMAMKGSVVIFNRVVLESEYNNNGGRYATRFKDPVDRFIKVEKYFRLASEFAVEHGVTKKEAKDWLITRLVNTAVMMLNNIGKNPEMLKKFTDTLLNYEPEVATGLLNRLLTQR